MRIPLFLSYPKPFMQKQEDFLNQVRQTIEEQGFDSYTVSMNEPVCEALIDSIRDLIERCDAMIMIAFRRTWIQEGMNKKNSDLGQECSQIYGEWLTSVWCQIEAAMAYQKKIPILIFAEEGVRKEGLLGRRIYFNTIDFDLQTEDAFSKNSRQWIESWQEWKEKVCQEARKSD